MSAVLPQTYIVSFDTRQLEPASEFDLCRDTQRIPYQRPRSFTAVGIGLGLFLAASTLLVAGFTTYVFTTGKSPSSTAETVAMLLLVWTVAAAGTAMGGLLIHDEHALRGRHRIVTFDRAGVTAEDVSRSGTAHWSAAYADFSSVVLSVDLSEQERDNRQKIELRHVDQGRSVLLHKSQGSGLHPDIRRRVIDIARHLGLRPYVETNGTLVPLAE